MNPVDAIGSDVSRSPHELPRAGERLIFRFLREAPYLPNAGDLGVATAAVEPWPHQLRVVRRCVERFPENFLFCDEVGLGKTIEAGLVLRQLVISGRVRRALLLVPRAVLRQWQEELFEKLALQVPRFSGGAVRDVFDRELRPAGGAGLTSATGRPMARTPWNDFPLLLASTQLAKRRDRQAEILAADSWDLVIVDEAHHARRLDRRRRRPNRLLELLAGGTGRRGLQDRTRCLYLLTATPMQVDPVELWDLLKVLGLGGRWGAHEESFLRFYTELGRPAAERDWDFLFELHLDHLESGGRLDPAFVRRAAEVLGQDDWERLRDLPHRRDRGSLAARLEGRQAEVLEDLVRRHTPLRSLTWRHTRSQLRRYHREGRLAAAVPERRPENVWIVLDEAERRLYDRIEEYLSELYLRYEAERPGLGFVMTVYRRRLTSSFRALTLSLERRREALRAYLDEHHPFGAPSSTRAGVVDEDLEIAELDAEGARLDFGRPDGTDDEGEDSPAPDLRSEQLRDELAYLDRFLEELAAVGPDSKLRRLCTELDRLLEERDTVLVFTQYTDTLDYLRDALRDHRDGLGGERRTGTVRTVGAGVARTATGTSTGTAACTAAGPAACTVACYSGRGGERWDGRRWSTVPKEVLKEAFARGEIRVLLCTDAASEGLNFQTCGTLINYDMPWNPMRVEQRIGRLDRLGQRWPEVRVFNYFYDDTVEAVIYRRLHGRIRAFESIVGNLQPILHRVGEVLREVAMTTPGRRPSRLDRELAELDRVLERRPMAPDLDPDLEPDPAEESGSGDTAEPAPLPAGLPEIESAFLSSEILGPLFRPDSEKEGVFRLSIPGGDLDRDHENRGNIDTYHDERDHVFREDHELQVTFSPAVFDRYPSSVELLTYGNPTFETLLDRVAAPDESDEPVGLGLYGTRSPYPVSLFVAPGDQGVEPVKTLDDLRHRLAETPSPGPWTGSHEGHATSLYSRVRQRVLLGIGKVEEKRRRAEHRALREAARQILSRAALVELARDRHRGLFDEALPWGFGRRAVAGLERHGSPFTELLAIARPTVPEARSDDPFFVNLVGRTTGRLDRRARGLVVAGRDLVERHRALVESESRARENLLAPSAVGLLERHWFPLSRRPAPEVMPLRIVDPSEVRPFENSVPLYDGIEDAARRVEAGEDPQGEERRMPADFTWVELPGRTRPHSGLFVVRMPGEALNRRVPAGAWCLFRFGVRGSRSSPIVLAEHHRILDPDLGGHQTVRYLEDDIVTFPDGSWSERRTTLKPASTDPGYEPVVLEEPEADDLRLIAELVEVLA